MELSQPYDLAVRPGALDPGASAREAAEGVTLAQADEFEAALPLLRAALSHHPTANRHFDLGLTYLRLGRFDGA